MKRFLRYILAPRQRLRSGKRPTSTRGKEREKAGMDGWMTWVRENEASIVELGSPLGKTKRMNAKGISDTQNQMTAYTIVQAESHEAAAELFASHPHFMIFPGDFVKSKSWNVCRYRGCRLRTFGGFPRVLRACLRGKTFHSRAGAEKPWIYQQEWPSQPRSLAHLRNRGNRLLEKPRRPFG